MTLILFLVFVATAVAQPGCTLDPGAELDQALALDVPWVSAGGVPEAGVTTDTTVGGICHIISSTLALEYADGDTYSFSFPGLSSITTTSNIGLALSGSGVTGFSAPLLTSIQGQLRAIYVNGATSFTSLDLPLLATAEQVDTSAATIQFQFATSLQKVAFLSLNDAGANPLKIDIQNNGLLTCVGLPNIPSTTIGTIAQSGTALIVLTVPGAGAPCTAPAGLTVTAVDDIICGDDACCPVCGAGDSCYSNVCSATVPTGVMLVPETGPDTGGTSVTISGADLNLVTDVLFGGVSGTITTPAADETSDLIVDAPPGSGTVNVALVTPDKKRATTTVGTFTYVAPIGPTE